MLISNQINTNLTFKAGKTTIYSDFDGTYMPYSHSSICSDEKSFPRKDFHQTFSEMAKFFDTGKENTELVITTGRNMPKFEAFLNHIRRHNESIPLPEKVIISNGGDIYQLKNSKTFFETQSPLQSTNDNIFNNNKLNDLKRKINWYPDTIKDRIVNFFRNKGFDVFDSPVNEFSDSYPHTILEELNNRNYNHNNSMFASIQDDGKTGFYIALNKDISSNSDWFEILKGDLGRELSDQVCTIIAKKHDSECGKGTSFRILPKVNQRPLDKLYDTRKAIEEIIKQNSNDLVIIAGDDVNDIRMLNPFSYVPLADHSLKSISENIVDLEDVIYHQKMYTQKNPSDFIALEKLKINKELLAIKIDEFNKKISKDSKLRQKIVDLPFYSIVIQRKDKICPISEEVSAAFKDLQKVVVVPPDKLLMSIKDGIKQQAKNNNNFLNGLSIAMLRLLNLESHQNSTSLQTSNKLVHKTGKTPIIAATAATAVSAVACYSFYKNKSDKTKEAAQ